MSTSDDSARAMLRLFVATIRLRRAEQQWEYAANHYLPEGMADTARSGMDRANAELRDALEAADAILQQEEARG